MEHTPTGEGSQTPWNFPEFLSEAGLTHAREYFFQTHGTQSRRIAEGRNAKGFTKSGVRRKLAKEMGDDFKMYTGVELGKGEDDEESRGIRGDLNKMIRSVYQKIAPQTPVGSPIQEDLTILRHPLGALEVVYCMVAFYTDLLKKYASFASNRRQVLKSVIDEELFKWLWRLYYSFALGDKSRVPNFRENIPSLGLSYIPFERQRLPTSDKIYEIGIFLLGAPLATSHLRFALSYYFVCYLRQIQFRLLPATPPAGLDAIFEKARTHKPEQPTDETLVAVDALMNAKGTSMQSYDDVLGDEEIQATKAIPGAEMAFLSRNQEFTKQRFPESLKKFLPQPQQGESADSQHASLMPIVLLLRTLPFATGQAILGRMPGPYLNLIKNRVSRGNVDDVSKTMLERIEEMIAARHKKGETYAIYSRVQGGTTPTVTRITPSQKIAAQSPAARSAGSAAPPGGAPASAARPPHPPPERPPPAAPSGEGAPAARPAPAGAPGAEVVVAWESDGARVTVTTLAAEEIIALTGTDPRFIVPWVLFAIQTGQVFALKPEQVSKEALEGILRNLFRAADTHSPNLLSAEERQQLSQQLRGLTHHKALREVMSILGVGASGAPRGRLAQGIAGLSQVAGGRLADLVRKPADPEYRPILANLPNDAKNALSILNRVSRAQ